MRKLNINQLDFSIQLSELLERQSVSAAQDEIRRQVSDIIHRVVREGDDALIELTQKFDGFEVSADTLEVPAARLTEALEAIPAEQREALEFAAQRVRDYHQHQLQESWSYTEADGTQLGQKVTPLKRAGLYVPGGLATYPSSVKYIDFGLAVELNDRESTIDDGKQAGTPSYISPELDARKAYSFATDIWSLGVVLLQVGSWGGILSSSKTGR